jgi:hypothetical protein
MQRYQQDHDNEHESRAGVGEQLEARLLLRRRGTGEFDERAGRQADPLGDAALGLENCALQSTTLDVEGDRYPALNRSTTDTLRTPL